MKLTTIKIDNSERVGIVTSDGIVLIRAMNSAYNTDFPTTFFELINSQFIPEIQKRFEENPLPHSHSVPDVSFAPPYRRPGKIWGIGLNYRDHADDIGESLPQQPASFMKPATTVIGYGDAIRIPAGSHGVTAEAELGVIMGRTCKNIAPEEALDYIFGYTCIIDMTEEDILKQNPRYLTRAKSFDTFFSFGPAVTTKDEVPEVSELIIRTVVNGDIRAENTVSNMTFDPFEIVSFHSNVMTLEPGDVFSTGTPGRWHIKTGDVVRCEISGFHPLECPVAADGM